MDQPPATPIPSQHQLRAELEAMVLGDLLGPASGEAEELTERTVRDRYLVGVLALSRSANAAVKPAVDEEEDEEIPLIPDELSEGGSDTADDGNTDADIPVVQAHLPSSFGMSFCVDGEAKSIKASAAWGQYKREKRDDQQDYKGNPLKVWKRYTRGGSITIPLKDGPIKAKAPDPQFPDVYIQGAGPQAGHAFHHHAVPRQRSRGTAAKGRVSHLPAEARRQWGGRTAGFLQTHHSRQQQRP